MAMDVSQLTKNLNDAASQSSSNLGEDERVALLTACDDLKRTLETPLEATVRFMFGVSLSHLHEALLRHVYMLANCCRSIKHQY